MSYHGPTHMYATFVSDILIKRGDFNAEWWQMVQPRVLAHRNMGTEPSMLADMFSDEWRVIRETGGWLGHKDDDEPTKDESQAIRDTKRFCAAARRHGFA